jgi:hypothetical protein
MSFAGCKSREEAAAMLRDFVAAHQSAWLREYRTNLLASDRDVDADTIDELCALQQLLWDARLELAMYRACDSIQTTATTAAESQSVIIAPTSPFTH